MRAHEDRFRPGPDQPNLRKFLESLRRQALILRDDVWPEHADYFLEYITMNAGTVGEKHHDISGFTEVVAIATPHGSSTLWVEDDTIYSLVPGAAVFLDPAADLEHQGIAGPNGERVGIVVAR